jgi:hypothetical protein
MYSKASKKAIVFFMTTSVAAVFHQRFRRGEKCREETIHEISVQAAALGVFARTA